MHRQHKGPVIFSILMAVVFAVAIIIAAGYGHRARMAPLVIAIPGFILTAGLLVIDLRHMRAEKNQGDAGKPRAGKPAGHGGSGSPGAGGQDMPSNTFSEINVFLWLALMLAMIVVLGFLITIPLYLFLYLRVRSREGWLLSSVVSLVSWAVLYSLFVRVLGMNLYAGVIAELIM